MKKFIKILSIVIGLIIFGNVSVFASDTYIEYDYVTGEEREVTITDDMILSNSRNRMLLNKNDLSEEAYNVDESEMSLGVSLYSMQNGSYLTRVTSMSTPYCKVVLLRLGRDTDGDGITDAWTSGTGFLVGPDVMVTAGHCMYGLKGGNVEEMKVYTRQNGVTLQSTYCYPSRWMTPTEYKETEDNHYDWCVVELQDDIGNDCGWFGYGVFSGDKKNVRVSGYPNETSEYTYFQYTSTGNMGEVDEYKFWHTCSALNGGVSMSQRIINAINYFKNN